MLSTGVIQPNPSTVTITAFVGRCLRGPVNTPITVTSLADYQRIFGGLWRPSTLSYAVEHYFEHGGTCAIIVRVANSAMPTTIELPCGTETLTFEARAVGSREFLRASVDYDNIADQHTDCFNLVLQRVRMHQSEHIESQESYQRVSINPATNRFVATVLLESQLVRVRGNVPTQRPAVTPGNGAQQMVGYINSTPNGNDGAPLTDYDLIGSATENTGMFALRTVTRFDFLYFPPLSRDKDVGLSTLLIATRFCREHHAMLIMDPPLAWQDVATALAGMRALHFNSDQVLMFFPRLMASDRLRGGNTLFANGGAVAGMLSHADELRPVWDSKQHEVELLLRPGLRLQLELSELDRWRLASLGINSLQATRRVAPLNLLRRTLAGSTNATADWSYLGPRRFALYVMGSLQRNTRWVLLASPGRALWARLVRQVNGFLHEQVALGAFANAHQGQEFFVICDERINDMAPKVVAGVNILVGFASSQPEQYHTFMLCHSLLGSCVRTVAVNRYDTPSNFEDVELTSANALLALR
jgi:phage tail sheath protein FI